MSSITSVILRLFSSRVSNSILSPPYQGSSAIKEENMGHTRMIRAAIGSFRGLDCGKDPTFPAEQGELDHVVGVKFTTNAPRPSLNSIYLRYSSLGRPPLSRSGGLVR